VHILLVEDDDKGARILIRGLEEEGFTVRLAPDAAEAERAMSESTFDVVILDWMLPGKDGITFCRELRERDPATPVIMLTAKDDVLDRIAGLTTGADDYLIKPFAFWELLARVRALLRRSRQGRLPLVRVADLSLDPVSHEVTRGDRVLDLTAREYGLLAMLAKQAGHVLTREELTRALGQQDAESASNLLDVHISHLRKKVDGGSAEALIHTVRGQGYCLGAQKP
jgi:DNA-binding response OmpR family regulator